MIECVVSCVWRRSVLLRSSNLVIKSYKKGVFSLFVLLYMTLFILLLNWTICTSCISLLRETREARAPQSTSSETSSFFSWVPFCLFPHDSVGSRTIPEPLTTKEELWQATQSGSSDGATSGLSQRRVTYERTRTPPESRPNAAYFNWAENVPASPAAAETRPPDFKGREKAGRKLEVCRNQIKYLSEAVAHPWALLFFLWRNWFHLKNLIFWKQF